MPISLRHGPFCNFPIVPRGFFEFSFFAFNKIWQIYTSPTTTLAQLTITATTTTTTVEA